MGNIAPSDSSQFSSINYNRFYVNGYSEVRTYFICPRCGYPQHCGCDNCIKRIPDGIKPTITTGNYGVICPNCFFRADAHWWTDYNWEIATENGQIERLPEYFAHKEWDGEDINYA